MSPGPWVGAHLISKPTTTKLKGVAAVVRLSAYATIKLMSSSRNHGFTIVELLIVVVVIAILATITITAYNGVQQKAQNAKMLVAVDAYKKALGLYMVDHGDKAPDYSALPSASVCLGTGYPDTNSDGLGDCVLNADNTPAMSAITAAQDPLVPYLGRQVLMGGGPFVASTVGSTTHYMILNQIRLNKGFSGSLDGKPVAWWISYVMQGKGNDCRHPIDRAPSDTDPNSQTFFSVAQSPSVNSPFTQCLEAFVYS